MLVALNAADVHRLSFSQTVLPEAARRGMGVIGMKVYGQGALIHAAGPQGRNRLTTAEAFNYTLSLPGVSTAVIGCSTPEEVAENASIARRFSTLEPNTLRDLESRTRPSAPLTTAYKRRT